MRQQGPVLHIREKLDLENQYKSQSICAIFSFSHPVYKIACVSVALDTDMHLNAFCLHRDVVELMNVFIMIT